jgi:hypothetical protein
MQQNVLILCKVKVLTYKIYSDTVLPTAHIQEDFWSTLGLVGYWWNF